MAIGSLAVRRGQRYVKALRWLFADACSNFFWRFFGVVTAQFFGTTCQAGALSLLIVMLERIERQATLVIPMTGLELKPEQLLEYMFATAFVLLLIGGVLIFVAQRQTIELSIDYEAMFGRRMLRSFAIVPTGVREDHQPLSRLLKEIRRLNSKDSIQTARAIRILLRGSNQLIIFVYASLAAIYFAPIGFSIILCAITLFSGLYYRANVSAAQNAVRLEKNRPMANARWREAQQALAPRPDTVANDETVLERTYSSTGMAQSQAAFRGRLSAPVYAELYGNIGLSIALVAAVVYVGSAAVAGTESWSMVLAVALIVQFGMVSFRGTVQSFTSATRLYPSIRRCQDAATSDVNGQQPDPQPIEALPIQLGSPEKERGEMHRLSAGDIAGLMSQVPVTRYSIGALLFRLTGGDEDLTRAAARSVFLVSDAFTPSAPVSVKDALDTKGVYTWSEIEESLGPSGILNVLGKQFCSDPHRVVGARIWTKLARHMRFQIAVARAVLADKTVAVVAHNVWQGIPDESRRIWAHMLENKIVLAYGVAGKRQLPEIKVYPLFVVGDGGVARLSSSMSGQIRGRLIASIFVFNVEMEDSVKGTYDVDQEED